MEIVCRYSRCSRHSTQERDIPISHRTAVSYVRRYKLALTSRLIPFGRIVWAAYMRLSRLYHQQQHLSVSSLLTICSLKPHSQLLVLLRGSEAISLFFTFLLLFFFFFFFNSFITIEDVHYIVQHRAVSAIYFKHFIYINGPLAAAASRWSGYCLQFSREFTRKVSGTKQSAVLTQYQMEWVVIGLARTDS